MGFVDFGVLGAVWDFALSSIHSFSLRTLVVVRRRAFRVGVWFRVDPFRRGLIDAAIAYLKSGWVMRSRRLIEAVRQALAEVLALIILRRTATLAYIVGMRIVKKLGGMVNGKLAIIVGLQWLNTPPEYKTQLQ